MSNQPQPTVRSGEQLAHFDGSNDHLLFSREFWNKIIALSRGVLNTRDWRVSENGILVDSTPAAAAAAAIAGEWDPAEKYEAGVIVFFTPDGESASTFYSLQAVPAGISPDRGAPYWAGWPNAPAGLWA